MRCVLLPQAVADTVRLRASNLAGILNDLERRKEACAAG
jgi:hypothetical protein